MPHADASNFSRDIDKKQAYQSVQIALRGLLEGQTNWVCNLANASSLLWHMFHALPRPSSAVNWAGFYTIDPRDVGQLVLGPFQGKVACQTIRFGNGVCGKAAQNRRTIRVDDVESWPGHIACDGDSKSEIVVPLVRSGQVVGVLDVDCADLNGFDEDDQKCLEEIAQILAEGSEW